MYGIKISKQNEQLKNLLNTTLLSFGHIFMYLFVNFFALLMVVWFVRLSWFAVGFAITGICFSVIFCLIRGIVNPFGEYWFFATGKVIQPSIEERRVWSFLKRYKVIKIIILKVSSMYIIIIIMFKVFACIFKIKTFVFVGVINHLIVLIFYFLINSTIITSYVFRYIIKHWHQIQVMDIEPWPLGKPYMINIFTNKPIQHLRTILAPLIENQNQELNSFQTTSIFLGVIGIGLIFISLEKNVLPVFGITQRIKLIIFMIGVLFLLISIWVWKKKKDDR